MAHGNLVHSGESDTSTIRNDVLALSAEDGHSLQQVMDKVVDLNTLGHSPSCDRDAARTHRQSPGQHVEQEYVRLERGVWLVFGEIQVDEPLVNWTRERGMLTFSLLMRGAAMLTTASSSPSRNIYSEGQLVATSCSSDIPVCRHIPPGVRFQVVTLVFDGEAALERFGVDPLEVQHWLKPPNEAPGVTRPFRAAAGTPSNLVQKTAQAILWTPFTGSKRRLYLRSKAGELMCHFLTSPASSYSGSEVMVGRTPTDDSLAAIAHAAMSDPEHSPDLGELAVRLQVSLGRLAMAFKAKYGVTPREQMTIARLNHARRLLLQTRTPLIDVAYTCGYEHQSSFCTAYRKTFGESPNVTRRAVIAAGS